MSQAGSDDRPGAVFLVGNGLSIGASDAFRSVNLTKAALDELPAKALPFVQALAGVIAWDVDAPPAEPRHFEDLAGPLDHLADVLRLLPDASSEDLRMVEAALRREYKRLVACVVQKVMEAGQPPPPVYAPWDTTEELNARLRAASPSAGDLRRFARTLYEFAEATAATDHSPLTSVFTLNYDDLLERALVTCMRDDKKRAAVLNKTSHLGFGLREGFNPPEIASPDHILEIQHLHGCIYWACEAGVVRWHSLTRFESLLRAWRQGRRQEIDPVLILGNYKSQRVTRPPFREIYEYCRRRLAASRVCVVAGYGFGDLPVNRLLGEFVMRPENTLHLWTVDVDTAATNVRKCSPEGELRARVVPRLVKLPDPRAFETITP